MQKGFQLPETLFLSVSLVPQLSNLGMDDILTLERFIQRFQIEIEKFKN